MILIIKNEATEKSIIELQDYLADNNFFYEIIQGNNTKVMTVIGDTSLLDDNIVRSFDCVDDVKRITPAYKKVSRKYHPEDTIVEVNGIKIGGKENVVLIAGPCSIEGEQSTLYIAENVQKIGAKIFRGGAYKGRTSPYSFQGLKQEGLKDLQKVKTYFNMPIVSEILSIEQIPEFVEKVDIIQVGARNMQNYELLKALGKINKPILLKRGMSATIEELLMAAEYIVNGGNKNVILCERGIRTFEKAFRNTLDLASVPYLKKITHLPIIVDPSHGTGRRELVEPMTLAAIACGADGVMMEVHNNPQCAFSDGAQCIDFEEFAQIVKKSKLIAKAIGRDIY